MADTAVAHEGHTSSTGISNVKLGMWLFLGSECLLFGGLISTYMLYRGRVSNGPTPEQVYDIPFTSVSSFVLLMSSLTMVLAVSAAAKKARVIPKKITNPYLKTNPYKINRHQPTIQVCFCNQVIKHSNHEDHYEHSFPGSFPITPIPPQLLSIIHNHIPILLHTLIRPNWPNHLTNQ